MGSWQHPQSKAAQRCSCECVCVQWGDAGGCLVAKGADGGRWGWNQDGGETAYMKRMTEQTGKYFEK